MLISALLLLACSRPADAPEAIGADVYLPGMWEQRALTVRSGLLEAQGLHKAGHRARAAEAVSATYRGSFEPELERLVRERLSSERAAKLEYTFGTVQAAAKGGDGTVLASRVASLDEALLVEARELDRMQAAVD